LSHSSGVSDSHRSALETIDRSSSGPRSVPPTETAPTPLPAPSGSLCLSSTRSRNPARPGQRCGVPRYDVSGTRRQRRSARASIAESAMRTGLRRVKGCAAMAAPRHMAPIARTPDRIHRPAPVAVGMAGRTARRGRSPNRAQSRSNRRRRCSRNASRRGSAAATLSASLLIAAEGPWLSWWASPGFGPLPENRDAKDSEMPYARDPQ